MPHAYSQSESFAMWEILITKQGFSDYINTQLLQCFDFSLFSEEVVPEILNVCEEVDVISRVIMQINWEVRRIHSVIKSKCHKYFHLYHASL